jgi:hypothetical protein
MKYVIYIFSLYPLPKKTLNKQSKILKNETSKSIAQEANAANP